MADYQAACGAADKASGNAKCKNTHDLAAKAHRVAASAAFASGKPDLGKSHSKKAQEHAAKGNGAKPGGGLAAWMAANKKK